MRQSAVEREICAEGADSPGRLAVRSPSHDSYPGLASRAGATSATVLSSAELWRIFAVAAVAQPLSFFSSPALCALSGLLELIGKRPELRDHTAARLSSAGRKLVSCLRHGNTSFFGFSMV